MTAHVTVGIVGASGYTGAELVRWLLRHPKVQLGPLVTRQSAGVPYSDLYPEFKGQVDSPCCDLDPQAVLDTCDVIFVALPHQTVMQIMPQLLMSSTGKKTLIIDLSADYRLNDSDLYLQTYGLSHQDPQHLQDFTYGLAEVYCDQLRSSRLIANPGCFPTASLLALWPLVREGLIDLQDIVIDAKTGVSGAGKALSQRTHFVNCTDNVLAYKVGTHQHQAEMQQELLRMAGSSQLDMLFTAHLLPIARGILSTIYVRLKPQWSLEKIQELYHQCYAASPFVRLLNTESAQVKSVLHSNHCDIALRLCGSRLVITSAIDNLVKGASGQAIQNMNLALGFPETMGLLSV